MNYCRACFILVVNEELGRRGDLRCVQCRIDGREDDRETYFVYLEAARGGMNMEKACAHARAVRDAVAAARAEELKRTG